MTLFKVIWGSNQVAEAFLGFQTDNNTVYCLKTPKQGFNQNSGSTHP